MPAQTQSDNSQTGNDQLSPEVQAAVDKALAQAEVDKQTALSEAASQAEKEKQTAIQTAIENERAQRPNPPPSFAASPVPGGAQQQAVQIMSSDTAKDEQPYVHDESVAGGLFMVRGKLVNSNGLRVNDQGQRVMPDGKTLMSAEDVMRENLDIQSAQMQAVVANIAK